jgi:nucleotide-binding universal stress UspA family protein
MKEEKRILFGIDGSDFGILALSETGELLKNIKKLNITLFHGAPDVEFPLPYQSICPNSVSNEQLEELQHLESEKVLKRAKEALIKSGIDQNMISTVLEKKCQNPSEFMLNLADQDGIDTIAVARWGKATVSRQVIGTVPYRLSQMANNPTLWVVDHRIGSRDILVCLVGAPISQRVVEYTVRYFSHLKESKFTLFHVVPRVPPQFWGSEGMMDLEKGHDMQQKITMWVKEYAENVKKIADYAKNKLIKAGVLEQNIFFKIIPQKIDMANDIFAELESGNYGILVIGRKGYKNSRDFGLGSQANKLLIKGRGYVICIVN